MPVVVAHVHECDQSLKPCRVASTGKAYLRGYDGDYLLSALEEQAFLSARSAPMADRQPVPDATPEDLDPDLVEAFTASIRRLDPQGRGRFSDQSELLRRSGVLHSDGRPTVAGVLALGLYPQQWFPRFVIQAGRRARTTRARERPGTQPGHDRRPRPPHARPGNGLGTPDLRHIHRQRTGRHRPRPLRLPARCLPRTDRKRNHPPRPEPLVRRARHRGQAPPRSPRHRQPRRPLRHHCRPPRPRRRHVRPQCPAGRHLPARLLHRDRGPRHRGTRQRNPHRDRGDHRGRSPARPLHRLRHPVHRCTPPAGTAANGDEPVGELGVHHT